MKKDRKQSFMQGIITLMFSQVLIKILGLAYKLYLTNKEGYGDVGNAISSSGFQIYALLLTISSAGVPNAISKLISERLSIGDERGASKIFKVAFATFSLIGFAGSTFLFFNAHYLANYILEIPEAELTLMCLAPSIFFVSLISVYRGYFNGYQNMRPMAKSQTVEQLAKMSLSILLVEIICYLFGNSKDTTGLMSAVSNLATTIATFISFVYLSSLYIKERKDNNYNKVKVRGITNRQILKNIIIIAMPMTISAILGGLNRNIDSITVVRDLKNFLTEEQAQVQYGILSGKVETLVTFPFSFNIAFATALVPAISAAKASKNIENAKKRISLSLLITILIGLPCSIGMFIYAEPILKLLFPNASSGAFIFKISAMSIIFVTIGQTITGALHGIGKTYVPIFSLLVGVILKLIINLTFVKINPDTFILGGVAGASFGTLICHIVSMLINTYILRKHIKFEFSLSKFIIKPIIAVTFMGIISLCAYKWLLCIFVEKLAIILTIIIAVFVYIIFILILKIFNKEELKMIPFLKRIKFSK